MKTHWLFLFVSLILLVGFFSSPSYTGQYVRATEGRLGSGQTSGFNSFDTTSNTYQYYEIRDRNTESRLVSVRRGDQDLYKTKLSEQPTFTMTTLLQQGKGDLDCDGDVDTRDLHFLNEAFRRTGNSLDATFGKGLMRLFDGVGNNRAQSIGNKDICSIEAGDINSNQRLDHGDYELLYSLLYSGGELEFRYVQADCGDVGSQRVNELGEVCTCISSEGPYTKESCVSAPHGFRAVQSGHHEVKFLPIIPQESY